MISIGIDIGSFSVKVAYAKATANGFEILRTHEYPLNQDPTKDNTIDIIEALRAINATLPNDTLQFTACVYQENVSLRKRVFPFKERHKILKSLPFELEDDIPLTIENSIFEGKITHYVGGSAHVMAMACPRENVTDSIEELSDGGIHPDILSVEGVAIGSLFEEWRESPKQIPEEAEGEKEPAPAEAVVHIGHKSSVVVILQDGHLHEIRHIDWGAKDIAQQIAKKYNLHYLEALKELRNKGFILTNQEGATKEQIALSDTIKASVDDFAQVLKLDYLESETQHNLKIKSVTLTGGGSKLRNLGPYLTQKTEVATNRLGQVSTMPYMEFGASPNNEVAHVLSIGLALEGLKRPKNPAVNLLKGDYARENKRFNMIWDKWSHAIKVASACLAIIFLWAFLRDGFASDVARATNDKLRDIASTVTGERRFSMLQVRTYIREQNQKARMRGVMEDLGSINSGLDILKTISNIAPPRTAGGLKILNFDLQSDVLRISGEAQRAETVTSFQNSLQSLATDGNVQATTEGLRARPGYRPFSFTLRVSRKGGP